MDSIEIESSYFIFYIEYLQNKQILMMMFFTLKIERTRKIRFLID